MNPCQLLFQMDPGAFLTEQSWVTLMISLLSGPALTRVLPLLETSHPSLRSVVAFLQALEGMFEDANWAQTVEQALNQGCRSVSVSYTHLTLPTKA